MQGRSGNSIKDLFSEIPTTYDLLNRILSLGLDSSWRRCAASIGASHGGHAWADMCSGTGRMTACLKQVAPAGTTIYAVDFCAEMMAEAGHKLKVDGIGRVESDVRTLPFPGNSLDLVTMAFATRNLNIDRSALVETFSEFHRVLKPGGFFVNLETTVPPSSLMRICLGAYLRMFVRPVGTLVSGSSKAYSYLVRSMSGFYPAPELARIIKDAGFASVTFEYVFPGVAAIHKAVKSGRQ
jgi:demethylmenaquinone methyltransferase/2-methoxy-6-polyprenyl-1,4-benzoquinol methylase